MRVHPWIVSILSVMAFSAGHVAWGQSEDSSGFPAAGDADASYFSSGPPPLAGMGYPGSYVPPPPAQPAGAWDPIAAGQNGGPGYHPDRRPWPHISPFEDRYAEHTNESGLWFFRRDNSPRQYFANIDYRHARYRRPDVTRVGSDVGPQTFEDPAVVGIDAPFLPTDTGVFFSSFLGNFEGVPGPRPGQQNQPLTVNNIAVGEQSREANPRVNGFQVNWGYLEPGGNGLDVSGWYTPEAHWAYSRGFNPTREDVLNRTNFSTGRPLAITHALPINDGTPNGGYVTYDRFFGLDFETVSGGGDVNWIFTPFWRGNWYQFAPTAGFQFMYIGENFALNAADSGASLVYTVPPGLENPATFVSVVDPYESQILSEVKSYLLGPQIGLRFVIGGDNLRILGHSQVGLAMNHERMELSSFGVGDGFGPFFDPSAPRFRERQNHTRLSPTTAHEVTAEARLFQYIPVIRKVHFLNEAMFRFGYQIQAAFEIQRPHRTVEYNGFPLIPAIRNDQETRWYVNSYNFGIHWNY